MSDDFKQMLHSIRKSLEKNEMPTKKTCFWLLEELQKAHDEIQRMTNTVEIAHEQLEKTEKEMRELKATLLQRLTDVLS